MPPIYRTVGKTRLRPYTCPFLSVSSPTLSPPSPPTATGMQKPATNPKQNKPTLVQNFMLKRSEIQIFKLKSLNFRQILNLIVAEIEPNL